MGFCDDKFAEFFFGFHKLLHFSGWGNTLAGGVYPVASEAPCNVLLETDVRVSTNFGFFFSSTFDIFHHAIMIKVKITIPPIPKSFSSLRIRIPFKWKPL